MASRALPRLPATALALLVIVLGAVLIALLDPFDARPGRESARPPVESGAPLEQPPALVSPRADGSVARHDAVAVDATGPSGPRIRFRVLAEDGTWGTDADGTGHLRWSGPGEPRHWWLDVAHGAAPFPDPLPDPARPGILELLDLVLDGHRAVVLTRGLRFPDQGDLTIDCELVHGPRLIVLDAETRAPSEDLRLVLGYSQLESLMGGDPPRGPSSSRARGPSTPPSPAELLLPLYVPPLGEQGLLADGLSSPIELENRQGTHVYFVRSPRSAWNRVAVDHEHPVDRVVLLQPGGRVEFHVAGQGLAKSARLRIYPIGDDDDAGGEPTGECRLDEDGRSFLDGVPEGDWNVRLELGPSGPRAEVRVQARFTIVRDRATQVELELAPRTSAQPPAHLHGVILAPESIETAPWVLALVHERPGASPLTRALRLAEMRPDPSGPFALAWDAGELEPGEWSASIDGVQWGEDWQLEPGRDEDRVVDLSSLRRTQVRVLRRETLEPIEVARLEYRRTDALDGSGGWSARKVDAAHALQPIPFQGVEGPYTFWVRLRTGMGVQFEVPSLGGADGLRLLVDADQLRHASLRIDARSAGVPVPLPESWWKRVEIRDAAGNPVAPYKWSYQMAGFAGGQVTSVTYSLPTSGAVTASFPAAEGFRAVPSREVDLVDGEEAVLTVDLVTAY